MDLKLSYYDGPATRELAERIVIPLYEATNAGLLSDPFYSSERFAERLNAYASRAGFALVLAEDQSGRAVGQAFGYPLPVGSVWWDGLVTPVPEGFTVEDGTRTFALNELMVSPDHRRHGVARTLVDALLRSRTERRATLLVDAGNTAAKTAYEHWGWHLVGKVQPFPDAPVYDALILNLRLSN
jgi:GNAT superfamily N-acetyltransferase